MRDDCRKRGSAMVMTVVLLSSMSVLSLCLITTTLSGNDERKQTTRTLGAVLVAEAGISEAVASLSTGGDGNIGSAINQVGFGDASFYVTAKDVGSGAITLMASGTANRQTTTIEVTVRQTSQAFYRWAAFGDEGMTMDSNARTDSYNSALGTYDMQDVNGGGSNRYALENGDVGSNADVGMSQNSKVHGDLTPGPTGVATIVGSATVTGTTLPATDLVPLPPLVLPALPSTGDMTISSTTTWVAGNYSFDDFVIGTNDRLVIEGPAVVLAENLELLAGSEIIIDDTHGAVAIYVVDDFVMNSNSMIAPVSWNPASFQLYLNSDNILDPESTIELSTVEFNSNAQIFGTIYAPNALVDIDSNFVLFGSVVARRVHLDSNSRIHFDENLLNLGGDGAAGFEALCWRIVANP